MGRPTLPRMRLRGCLTIAATLTCTSIATTASGQSSPVQWTNTVNAAASGSALQKTTGCGDCADAGATSVQVLNQQDAFVEFVPTSGARLYAGLGSDTSSNTDPALIDFAFSFWPDGGWDVRERNAYRADGRFVSGDVFRVAVVSGVVKYYQNGALVYTSLVQPAAPLVVDTTLVTNGAMLTSAITSVAAPPPATPISVVTSALPDGSLGQPYAATLQAAGGSGSFVWSISGGALPPGMTLTAAGELGGAPTAWGTAQFVARATDASNRTNYGERALSITVPAPANAITIQTSTLASTRLAQSYSAALSASGGSGSFTWSIASGTLPQGMSLNSSTGVIQGSATTAGRFSLVVRASDAVDVLNNATRALTLSVLAEAPPSSYVAITDRTTRAKGPLQSLGPAGYTFTDPVFGSTITRITDRVTRPGDPERSYRTPSSSHANAWSADERYFYTVSTDGTVIPFSFDRVSGRASRLQPSATGEGGLKLDFFNEPTFSYIVPGIAYGTFNGTGANFRTVDQYDFETGQYSQLLNLDTLVPNLGGTYLGGLGISAGPVERIIAFFGGTSQDRHFYLVVFDRNNPGNRHVVNTLASTVDGIPIGTLLNFRIHAANIDRSGRFVILYPTGADLQPPRSAPPVYVWDTNAGTFTALPLIQAITGGHDAFGYGDRVNQDCCTDGGSASPLWDAVQFQYRSLSTPFITSDLVVPVLRPAEVYLDQHPSWHNAQPDRLVPFLAANYRYGLSAPAWRAWDEEIFAVQTEGAGSGATIWRFAHHRSAVADDLDPSRTSFWYTPRANISPDGQWALFTSNWEKTLGTDPRGEVGGMYRQDVFLLSLKAATVVQPVSIVTTTLPAGTASLAYSAKLQATGGSGAYRWTILAGSLPGGLALDQATGSISGIPAAAGSSTFTVRAADGSDASNVADRSFTVNIAPAPLPPVVIVTTNLANGTSGTAYSATLQASGGTGSYVWSVSAGTLPAGLSLSTTGTISGTPTAAGTTTFTVRATDAAGSGYADRALTITIAPQPTAPVTITTTKLPDGNRLSAYSTTVATSGGKLPFQWSITSGTLPPGLSLNTTTGTISGTPTQLGTWSFTVRVVDSASPTTKASRSFSIRVRRRL